MQPVRFSLIGIVLFMLTSGVLAGQKNADPDLPAIDAPDKWHLMTDRLQTTESKCIGDTSTVLCTIETLLACTMGIGESNVCVVAADDIIAYEWYFNFKVEGSFLSQTIEYRVIETGRLRSTPKKIELPEPERTPIRGDVFVRLRIREISPEKNGTLFILERYSSFSYYLRKVDGHWHILNFGFGKTLWGN